MGSFRSGASRLSFWQMASFGAREPRVLLCQWHGMVPKQLHDFPCLLLGRDHLGRDDPNHPTVEFDPSRLSLALFGAWAHPLGVGFVWSATLVARSSPQIFARVP